MTQKICTSCGYEGNGKREKVTGGGAWRVLGLLTMLPFYTVWKMIRGQKRSNICPHCGRHALVKLASGAGEVARRRFDAELGIIPVAKKEEVKDELSSFGNERPAQPVNKKPVNPDEW